MRDGADETELGRVQQKRPKTSVTVASPQPSQFCSTAWFAEVYRFGRVQDSEVHRGTVRGLRLSCVRDLHESRVKGLPCNAFDNGSRIAPEVVEITGRTGVKEFKKCLRFISS